MFKNLEIDEDILKKNRIPLLIKSKDWKVLFSNNTTKNIQKLSEKLEELITAEKKALSEMRAFQKEKKVLMDMVLKLSDEVNTNNNIAALNKLEDIRKRIPRLNKEIDDLQFKLETLPKEIEKINFDLLSETVLEAYSDIKKDRIRVEHLDEKIQKLRVELGEMWEEKFSKEKKIDDLYNYLHGTLGHEETDKLDRKFF